MMESSFVLGVVLYHPTQKQIQKIYAYLDVGCFSKIIVINNTPDDDISFDNNLIISVNNRINLGLSKPYNMLLELSKDYDYLCLMDQDSIYDKQEISNMVDFINKNPSLMSDVGIIAPRSYASISKRIERSDKVTETKYTINSGSFLNLRLLQDREIKYDEQIFLDYVDVDYCYSVRKAGLKVLVYENSILYQELGYDAGNNKKANHSPIRFYYINKGRKHSFIKRYGAVFGFLLAFFKMFKTIAYILLREDCKSKKIGCCLKGVFC